MIIKIFISTDKYERMVRSSDVGIRDAIGSKLGF